MRAYDNAVNSANPVRIALVQMRCEKAAIPENLRAIDRHLDDAETEGADVVLFPEMSITGYADPTRMPGAILSVDGATVARFLSMTRGRPAAVVAGIIEANPGGKPFITQIVARDGAIIGVYRKRNIAEDEAPWFDAGREPCVFDHAGTRFGISVCADIYKPKVFSDCAALGARVILEAAAPGLYGEQHDRNWETGWQWWRGECHQQLGGYARELGVHIAVATQAGRTLDEDFPGGGYLFGPDGSCLAETADWSEGMLIVAVPSVQSPPG